MANFGTSEIVLLLLVVAGCVSVVGLIIGIVLYVALRCKRDQ
jgi:hypothetical protein